MPPDADFSDENPEDKARQMRRVADLDDSQFRHHDAADKPLQEQLDVLGSHHILKIVKPVFGNPHEPENRISHAGKTNPG